jgi:hypothetical protein
VPTPVFTNLDAQFLFDLAGQGGALSPGSADSVRLAAIAQRLQSLDEKLARATADGTYAEGVIEGQRRMLAKSNLVDSRGLSVQDGRVIASALASGGLRPKKIPLGHTRKAELEAAERKKVIVLPAKGKPAKRGHRLEDL